jgi:hypothetical protein
MVNADNSFPGSSAIFRALSVAGGRYEAFQFVMKCHGDLSLIEAEIQEQGELILALLDGPMKLGATPRVHKDSYLAGLKEAIEILRQHSA